MTWRQGLILMMAIALLFGRAQARADEPPAAFLRLGPVTVAGDEVDRLELGLGVFDAFDQDTTFAGALEYRLGRKAAFLGPALGLLANADGGIYGYLGLYLDLAIGSLHVTPMLAAGGYREGSSKDLGGVLQFRQSVLVAWQFGNGHRLGAEIAHISNANLYAANPGQEDLLLTYAVPLGPLF